MDISVPELALAPLRKQIDTIDAQILDLINQRLNLGQKVGEIKREKGRQVLDRTREKQVIENLLNLNQGPADNELLRFLFNVIITATREVQRPKTIAYVGHRGGFPHQAALNHFCHSGDFVSQAGLDEVFRSVEKGESDFGVAPVENSMEGTVAHTLDRFTTYGVSIVGEHYETLTYDLISITGNADHVDTIAAPQGVWEHCRDRISRGYPRMKIHIVSTASQAIEAALERPETAVIAPGQTAALHGLLPIETQVQDAGGNVTRYLIIGREAPQVSDHDKTSVMFAVPHKPGALLRALAPVENTGVNMLKLESRPTRKDQWQYYFFMDLEGHITHPTVAETIGAVEAQCLSLRILGSYPAHERQGE